MSKSQALAQKKIGELITILSRINNSEFLSHIEACVDIITQSISKGNKVLIAGLEGPCRARQNVGRDSRRRDGKP